ncbi:MAG: hypothetical protein OXQ29_08625 [Rhodospirillaceae bacterium]|nr:hypothetical protein [Rhodospirillaceae bacterium]
MTADTVRAAVTRAFGADNRERLLREYFSGVSPVFPETAWKHVYRLLLWIDRTTGLAHCYESDKSQPGRPWYERSLRFHAWMAECLGSAPGDLQSEVDWLFKHASQDLAAGASARQQELARSQRARTPGMPEPGRDPELESLVLDALEPWLQEPPPSDAMRDLTDRIHQHTRLENKRKNLVGEGFEDVLAVLIRLLPASTVRLVRARCPLHEVPGFYEPRGREKPRIVDLAIVNHEERRSLITAKWSVRADREEQFISDCASYVHLERAGQSFDYVLITNEFDPARLVAAAERQREGSPLFTSVVHVSPEALKAAYGNDSHRSFARVLGHLQSGRIESLANWLSGLQR